jgi:hypothetical protein
MNDPPGGMKPELNSGMLLWAVCESESSFFHITVLFTPIMTVIIAGVKPSLGFTADPGTMITTICSGGVRGPDSGLVALRDR